jgi:simple sugar transport system permease protein
MTATPLRRRFLPASYVGTEVLGLLAFLAVVLVVFGVTAPRFLTGANLGSIAFQLPELGLLTLAMLIPIISGGINLAIVYTANIAGLTLAWVLNANGGVDAGTGAFVLGIVLALGLGFLSGAVMGAVIAFTGAHPILVSLAMMIFLRGLGEFLTRGGDISGFPDYLVPLGHGSLLGVPVPLLLFAAQPLLGTCSSRARGTASRPRWSARTSRRRAIRGSTSSALWSSSTRCRGSCAPSPAS